MSWRVIAALMVAVFAILLVSTMIADPLVQVTDTFEGLDGADQDVEDQADEGFGAFNSLVYILVFGLIGWAGWRVVRREVTEGRL